MRCFWVNLKNPEYIEYHDKEWGVPLKNDGKLYELFLLECFQAGLSWECILNKREAFRRAFDGFDIDKVTHYVEEKISALMLDSSIIRHRKKIEAAISNSRIFRDIQIQFGSFDRYLRSFAGDKVIFEPCDGHNRSPLSDAIAADLKKRGMRFAGSITIYSFLQAAGIINAHEKNCYLFSNTKESNHHV